MDLCLSRPVREPRRRRRPYAWIVQAVVGEKELSCLQQLVTCVVERWPADGVSAGEANMAAFSEQNNPTVYGSQFKLILTIV